MTTHMATRALSDRLAAEYSVQYASAIEAAYSATFMSCRATEPGICTEGEKFERVLDNIAQYLMTVAELFSNGKADVHQVAAHMHEMERAVIADANCEAANDG